LDSEFFVLATVASSLRLLALSEVREIVPAMALSRPEAVGGSCRGIANVRGELIPVFGEGRTTTLDDASQLIIVLHADAGQSIGLLADDILDIVALNTGDIRVQPVGRGRYARVAQRNGQTLVVMTAGDVLDAA
jgi:chemotaxis signal transduction protein